MDLGSGGGGQPEPHFRPNWTHPRNRVHCVVVHSVKLLLTPKLGRVKKIAFLAKVEKRLHI